MELFTLVWLCLHLFLAVEGYTEHDSHSLSVSVPYVSYVCPEGANATMICEQSGAMKHPTDHLQHVWLFTEHIDQRCHMRLHNNRTQSVVYKAQATSFSVTLINVNRANQGRYCCLALDMLQDSKHKPILQQRSYSHMILTITPSRNGSLTCTQLPPPPNTDSFTTGLVTAVLVICILCLPLLLILVFRQKQRPHSSRRAQELVRMDSEAQGHENPVYMAGSPQVPSRSVAQIMTRQSSETGRHLLSEPGTPYSPNPQGEVFFPAHVFCHTHS
ncbi:V-type immunoglobulin domain-containing suppressor of T-cell activation precursor [Silurus asotus]|nr:V-type immunoglobulin domain-containing suppressor of T-cell activation precursor [Silurus asotus]